MNSLLSAAKPLAFKMARGMVDGMDRETWEGLLMAIRTLIDARLNGDAAGYRDVYDRLNLPPDVGEYITQLLWSHYQPKAFEDWDPVLDYDPHHP